MSGKLYRHRKSHIMMTSCSAVDYGKTLRLTSWIWSQLEASSYCTHAPFNVAAIRGRLKAVWSNEGNQPFQRRNITAANQCQHRPIKCGSGWGRGHCFPKLAPKMWLALMTRGCRRSLRIIVPKTTHDGVRPPKNSSVSPLWRIRLHLHCVPKSIPLDAWQ